MRTQKRPSKRVGILCAAVLCAVAAAALLTTLCIHGGGDPMLGTRLIFGRGALQVGKDIPADAVTQFYHTVSTSTNPPHYQRFHFYEENGAHYFFHETRQGNHWPLTEADATQTGTVPLTEAQWTQLLAHLEGGRVTKREASISSGGSGPWMYLYWTGDRGKVQTFAFASSEKSAAFEAFCRQLQENTP